MQIKLENVNYIYNPGTTEATAAVRDISLELGGDRFIAVIGSTGSGKSTLMTLLNGLVQPSSGRILYDGAEIGKDKKALRAIRCRVGLVFQYPEYQLFDETVVKDVAFGPKNKGLSAAEALEKAKAALRAVGLPEELYEKSPFEISGGEKRRAAIAGVLAMDPEVLILDEPTAGLDPAGKKEILDLIKRYQTENHTTVIMVSHNMDEVAEYADRVIAMSGGRVVLDGTTHEVFKHREELREIGLDVPEITMAAWEVGAGGALTVGEAADIIMGYFRTI